MSSGPSPSVWLRRYGLWNISWKFSATYSDETKVISYFLYKEVTSGAPLYRSLTSQDYLSNAFNFPWTFVVSLIICHKFSEVFFQFLEIFMYLKMNSPTSQSVATTRRDVPKPTAKQLMLTVAGGFSEVHEQSPSGQLSSPLICF